MTPDDRQPPDDEPPSTASDHGSTRGGDAGDARAFVGDVPARIGNYRIVRQIGIGGMGRVFEAIQQSPRRVVALKILSPRYVATPEGLARFQREAQLLGRLNHANIAVIHEAGTFDLHGRKAPFFAMELIAGARPINEYASAARLSLDARLRLFLDACEAVAHAHSRGVTHRDIKPSNLPVDRDGRLRLIDFGIARGAESAADLTIEQAPQGRVMGTLRYMCPEQIDGRTELVDHRSDVFALGVVGYELLCGRLPYPVGLHHDAAEIREIMADPANAPMPPSHWIPALPASIDAVILRALSLEPVERFATARQMADALIEALRRPADRAAHAVPAASGPAAFPIRRLVTAVTILALGTALAMGLRSMPALRWVGGTWFERSAATWTPASVAPDDLARNVAIVAITDDTDLGKLAREWGLPDPQQVHRDPWTLRALHGRAIPLMVNAGARAVVFDIAFEGARPTDEAFVAGIRAAADAGVPVVSVMPRWNLEAVSPAIRASGMRFGGATGYPAKDGFWDADIALQRVGREAAVPSVALITGLLVDAPKSRWALMLPETGAWAEVIELADASPSEVDSADAVVSRRLLRVARVDVEEESKPNLGIARGDRKAISTIAMPSDEAFAVASLDYGALSDLSPEELRRRVAGRVAMVMVLRDAGGRGERRYRYPGGRELPASYIQAGAIHGMLGGGWVSPAGRIPALAHAAVFCALAVAVGVLFRRRGWWVAPLVAVALVFGAIASSVMLFASMALLLNPMPTAVASLVALTVGWIAARPAVAARDAAK